MRRDTRATLHAARARRLLPKYMSVYVCGCRRVGLPVGCTQFAGSSGITG